jgi:uncharacterized protein
MTAFADAFWHRLDLPGSDAAHVSQTADGYELCVKTVFLDPRGPTALRYLLNLSPDWSTREGRIHGFVGEQAVDLHIVRTQHGWTLNGRDFGMAKALDLDLGFTPATNMAQHKRIALSIGDDAAFDVAWLDTGADNLQLLPQQYRRVSEFGYDYCSPTTGYQAAMTLAPNGFAAVYPGLWKMESH